MTFYDDCNYLSSRLVTENETLQSFSCAATRAIVHSSIQQYR